MKQILINTISILLFAMACGNPNSTSTLQKASQFNGTCTLMDSSFGSKSPPATCTKVEECAAACCICEGTSAKSWAAAACINGKCTSADLSCSLTRNDAVYCN